MCIKKNLFKWDKIQMRKPFLNFWRRTETYRRATWKDFCLYILSPLWTEQGSMQKKKVLTKVKEQNRKLASLIFPTYLITSTTALGTGTYVHILYLKLLNKLVIDLKHRKQKKIKCIFSYYWIWKYVKFPFLHTLFQIFSLCLPILASLMINFLDQK